MERVGAGFGMWMDTAASRKALGAIAAYALLAVLQTRIGDDFATRCYGGGRGDPGHDGWVLARVTRQLVSQPWRPFEGNIYYPSHSSVLFWDPLLGPAVLVSPLRLLGANPVLLYNAATLLSLFVASCGGFLLARRLGAGPRAALLAGIVVPYTGQQMARLVHLNLLAIPFFPFLLVGLLDLLERPRLRAALLAALAFVLQAATSGYHAFSAALVVLVTLAWGVRRLRDRRVWIWGALAAALAAVLLYPYVAGFVWLRTNDARMLRGPDVAAHASLDLAGFFVSHAYAWRRLLPGGAPFFPGLVVLVLAALALRQVRRDPRVRLLALLALAAFALALGPQVRWRGRPLVPGPFALVVRHVPLADAMRHPYTFAVPGLMALGLLASLGFERSGLSRSRLGFALVLVAATAETLSDAPARHTAPTTPPPVYADLAALPPGAVLELPFHDRAWTWWAGFHDLPIVNGVGAFEPERYQALWQLMRHEWRGAPRDMQDSRSLAHLKTWFPARYVLVHARGGRTWRRFVEATPRSFVFVSESAEGDRVYRFRRGGRGSELARAWRDDQLRGARLRARVAGTPGAVLQARLNGTSLNEPVRLEATPRDVTWELPPGHVRRGLNLLELRAEPLGSVIELEDIEAR